MFRSKNTKFKIQSITLNAVVIPHQENTNVNTLPTLKRFPARGNTVANMCTQCVPKHCIGI